MRTLAWSALAVVMCGCATREVAQDRQSATYNVDRRLLAPEGAGAAGAIQPYTLAASERFRMPRPIQVPSPALPAELLQASQQATTVCVQVILDATGQVQRSEPLLAHSACSAGADPTTHALVQAARDATAQWTFEPAALCHFAAGQVPRALDDCTGAARIEPVPVTLAYAFTFEVVEGKAVVRSQTGLR